VIASCTLVERTRSESTSSGFGRNSCDVDLQAHCSTTVQRGNGRSSRAAATGELMDLTPYLNFNGTCAAAFNFYAEVLNGEVVFMQTHRESPAKDYVGPDWQDKVMHACVKFGNTSLMGTDAPESHYRKPQGITVSITVPSRDEANRIFQALAQDGRITMPFEKTFWSEGWGALIDRFGTPWMVNTAQAS
jgi:PhnB protein